MAALNPILTSSVLALAALMNLSAARADDAVVGNGTGASCTEAAFDAAIAQLNRPGFRGGCLV